MINLDVWIDANGYAIHEDVMDQNDIHESFEDFMKGFQISVQNGKTPSWTD